MERRLVMIKNLPSRRNRAQSRLTLQDYIPGNMMHESFKCKGGNLVMIKTLHVATTYPKTETLQTRWELEVYRKESGDAESNAVHTILLKIVTM